MHPPYKIAVIGLGYVGLPLDIHDPHASAERVAKEYDIRLKEQITNKYDAIVLAVPHNEFRAIDYKMLKSGPSAVIFDTKSILERSIVDNRL